MKLEKIEQLPAIVDDIYEKIGNLSDRIHDEELRRAGPFVPHRPLPGVMEERERCAKIVESLWCDISYIAAKIRCGK